VSSFGKHFATPSIVSLVLPSLMTKSSACMEG
jgi:hypothetical protein